MRKTIILAAALLASPANAYQFGTPITSRSQISAKTKSKISQIIIKEEGVRYNAYLDSNGVWTIGIGNITYPDGRKVKEGDRITESEAQEMMYNYVDANITQTLLKLNLTEEQLPAMASFLYNFGGTKFENTVLKEAIIVGDWALVEELWVSDYYSKWQLYPRRKRELETLLPAQYRANPTAYPKFLQPTAFSIWETYAQNPDRIDRRQYVRDSDLAKHKPFASTVYIAPGCTGTFISPTHIATAASCVIGNGEITMQAAGTKGQNFTSKLTDFSWSGLHSNDFAILETINYQNPYFQNLARSLPSKNGRNALRIGYGSLRIMEDWEIKKAHEVFLEIARENPNKDDVELYTMLNQKLQTANYGVKPIFEEGQAKLKVQIGCSYLGEDTSTGAAMSGFDCTTWDGDLGSAVYKIENMDNFTIAGVITKNNLDLMPTLRKNMSKTWVTQNGLPPALAVLPTVISELMNNTLAKQ